MNILVRFEVIQISSFSECQLISRKFTAEVHKASVESHQSRQVHPSTDIFVSRYPSFSDYRLPEKRVHITLQYLKTTEFSTYCIDEHISMLITKRRSTFLRIKGHRHNIFNFQIGQHKMGKSVLTSSQHQYCLLHNNHRLWYSFHLLLLCQDHRLSLLYLSDMLTSLYQYIKWTTILILLILGGTY